jgi:hypothetical protein
MLRRAPDLYGMAKWASDKPHLFRLVQAFEYLRNKLSEAPIVVHCANSGCNRTPTTMALPLGYDGCYWPDPDFWCKKHGPSEDERNSGKLSISLDTIKSFDHKKNRSAVHRSVLIALGIKSRSRITEKYALEYFARPSQLD